MSKLVPIRELQRITTPTTDANIVSVVRDTTQRAVDNIIVPLQEEWGMMNVQLSEPFEHEIRIINNGLYVEVSAELRVPDEAGVVTPA